MKAAKDQTGTSQLALAHVAGGSEQGDDCGVGESSARQGETYSVSGVGAVRQSERVPAGKGGCGYQEMMVDFLEGRLEGEHIDHIDQHLAACSACQELLLARPAPAPELGERWIAGAPRTFACGAL